MTNFEIIIPTINRPDYFRRILSYYDSFEEDFKVIVADSSSDENKKINRETISSVSKLDILYLDSYSPDIPSYHKFADAVEHVKEKYCVFCADDDFVTPNGIKQSIAFLENNPDFTVALGRYIGFRLLNGGKKKRRFSWKFAHLPLSIEFRDSESRLEYHLSKYQIPTFYAVHRSKDLKMINREALKAEIDPFLFYELLSTMLTLIYGKMKCLDVLYGAHNAEPVLNSSWPSLLDAIKAGTFDEKYVPFRNCLAANLSKKSGLNTEESGKLVDRAMSNYMHSRSLRPILSIPKTKKRTILDSLHLPGWMYRGTVAFYAALYKALTIRLPSLYFALIVRPTFPFSKYGDDFNKVRSHALISEMDSIIRKKARSQKR